MLEERGEHEFHGSQFGFDRGTTMAADIVHNVFNC